MKNAKKILLVLLAIVALTLVMSISVFAAEHKAVDEASFKAAINNAVDGDTVLIDADFDLHKGNGWGARYVVTKAITIDLNGHTITTYQNQGSIELENTGCKLVSNKVEDGKVVRGTIYHKVGVAAIRVICAESIENININCTRDGDKPFALPDTNGAGGISVRNNKGTAYLGSIKNVTITGANLSYGIETWKCASNAEMASIVRIGTMENVVVNAKRCGLKLDSTLGTATNCVFKGEQSGIEIKASTDDDSQMAKVALVGCVVEGGEQAVYATINKAKNIDLTADATSSFVNTNGGEVFSLDGYSASNDITIDVPGFVYNGDGTVSPKTCDEHDFEVIDSVDASCEAAGSVTSKCKVCGTTTTVPAGSPTGHNYVETSRVEATRDEAGLVTYTCLNCNGTKEENLPKLAAVRFEVKNETEFSNALANAQNGDVIVMVADFALNSGSQYSIQKGITIDLNGHTLTTNRARGSIELYHREASITSTKVENGEIVRGTIIHTGGIAIIYVRYADEISNVNLVSDRGASMPYPDKNSGGISVRDTADATINLIENVSITGPNLSYGIETWKGGYSGNIVIKKMVNVTVDARRCGFSLAANHGEFIDCTFKGDVSGIEIVGATDYSTSLGDITLTGCVVEGGQEAVLANGNKVYGFKMTADADTSFVNTNGGIIFDLDNYSASSKVTVDVPGYQFVDGEIMCTETTHNYNSVVTDPTCTDKGYTKYTCTKCAHEYTGNETAATGHNYVESDRVDALPGVEGSVTYTCSGCGDSYSETIEALPSHTHTEVAYITQNPLPSNGHTAKIGKICSECNDVTVEPVEVVAGTSTDANFKINSAKLSLGEDIKMIYDATHPTNSSVDDMYMVFVLNGKETVVSDSFRHVSGNRYAYYYDGMRAHLLGDNIEAYAYAIEDGKFVMKSILSYSVKQYCVNQYKDKKTPEDIIFGILNLGDCVQKAVPYKADDLISDAFEAACAEKGISVTVPEVNVGTIDASYNVQTLSGTIDQGCNWKSGSLVMGNAIKLKIEFTAESLQGLVLKFEVNNREITINAETEAKYVSTTDGLKRYSVEFQVKVLEYDDTITCKFVKNGVESDRVLTYSVYSYIVRQYQSASKPEAEKQFMKALYAYAEAVKAASGQ